MGAHGSKSDLERDKAWRAMFAKYNAQFPDAPPVSAEDLDRWREEASEGQGPPVFLVDVRSSPERRVSVLPGAITQHEFDQLSEAGSVAKDARCVVYCTVGYRSGRYAEALRRQGKDAYNLAGGILAWTHHGGALEEPGGAGSTRAVHVFARKWDLAASAYESTYFM